MAAFAGEGEESFVAAVRAMESGETGCEVAAAEEGLDGGDGTGTERAEGLAVADLVGSEEILPTVVDDLPERRGAGMALSSRVPRSVGLGAWFFVPGSWFRIFGRRTVPGMGMALHPLASAGTVDSRMVSASSDSRSCSGPSASLAGRTPGVLRRERSHPSSFRRRTRSSPCKQRSKSSICAKHWNCTTANESGAKSSSGLGSFRFC